MISDAPNINSLWGGLIVEELIRCGVTFFCLSPGSRSTPLAVAVAAHPKARHVVHFDERGTAFFALGYARATGRPAAWITTSGTAAANGYPAVVEAATDGVPMLLLTADRPPELRATGANQAIDQVKLFGAYVRWQFDLPAPDPAVEPAMVLTTVDQAVYRARRAPEGPVHLNCMFREPLAPDPGGQDYGPYLSGLAAWLDRGHPYTTYALSRPAVDAAEVEAVGALLREVERGLLIVGRLEAGEGAAVLHLAEALRSPVLPDIASSLRLGGGGQSIAYYDQILSSQAFREAHAPEAVLHLGGRSTSKRLMQFLEYVRPRHYISVRADPVRQDPGHQVTRRIETDVAAFCLQLTEVVRRAEHLSSSADWLGAWQEASAKVGQLFDACFSQEEPLSEPMVARILSDHIPREHGLCIASSMPVRDMDMFAAPDGASPPVAVNRGASGIDGTVATAAGFAEGLGRPVTLLIGDLALLHDLNALALLRDRPVVAVVINNRGGGIFSFLPIARHEEVFEPFFGTPHGFTFAQAASLFGLDYACPSTRDAFVASYRAACNRGRSAIIEVTTDRAENQALHRQLLERVAAAL